MKGVALALALVLIAGSAFASNMSKPIFHDPEPYSGQVPGLRTQSIVVYTDDCYGYDLVLSALNQLGLGYDLYWFDYAGFETAVASGAYDVIIVNNACYFECSYAWDDIYNEFMAGKAGVIATFDWDGSDDYSGYVDDLLALNDHVWATGLDNATTQYAWNMNPVFAGTDGILSVYTDGYIDNGDTWSWTTAEGGITSTPEPRTATVNLACPRIYIGFAPDEMEQAETIQMWKNCILWVTSGPTATEQATWGGVKALYE